MNENKINSWNESIHVLKNKILTNELILKCFKNFVLDQFIKESDPKILVQFKIELDNGLIRTISRMQTITKKDYKLLLDIFNEYWSIKTEEYHLVSVNKVIFMYKIIDSREFPTRLSRVTLPKQTFTFKGYELPNTVHNEVSINLLLIILVQLLKKLILKHIIQYFSKKKNN